MSIAKTTAANPTKKVLFRTTIATGLVLAALAGTAITDFRLTANATEPETPAPSALPVTVANPAVRSIVEWDEYSGRFAAVDNVEIRARVSGYMTDISFKPGQVVQKGDLLFRIDPRPFEASLAAANADLESAKAGAENASAEYQRGKRLLATDAISKEVVDDRLRAIRQAEAQVAAAQARVDQAKLNLEFTEVRSPITGRISDDFVSEGNLIVGGAQGGTLLTTVVSTDPIHFEFTASEADYLKYLRLDRDGSRTSGRNTEHPVRVRLMDEDSFDHHGKLNFVDNQLDYSTGTMRGTATLANPDGLLAPGMFGRLQLIGSGEYEAVLIPDSAVQTDQSEKFVWVTDKDETAQRRPVKLGPLVDGLRVIRSGLVGDERVIVAGTQFVKPNTPVLASFASDTRLAHLNLK